MTNQLDNATSTLPGPLRSSLSSLLTETKSLATTLTNTILPPKTRQSLLNHLQTFTQTYPLLSSFLLTQVALSFFPLLLFAILAITVVIFALVTGLLVGLVGAVVFIVFAVGTALLVLLPTLFVTTFAAVTVWGWGVVGWFILKMFNEKRIPGVHRPLIQGIKEELGLAGTSARTTTSEAKSESENESASVDESDKEENGEKKPNGSTTKAEHHANGVANGKETHAPEKKVKLRKKPSKLSEKPERVDEKSSDTFEDREISNNTDTMGGVGKGVAGLKS